MCFRLRTPYNAGLGALLAMCAYGCLHVKGSCSKMEHSSGRLIMQWELPYPTLISSRQYGQSSAANLFVFASLYDTSTIETGLNIPYQKYEAFVLLGYVYYATTLFSN